MGDYEAFGAWHVRDINTDTLTMIGLAIVTTLVLASLSLLHVYWALGGRWGMASVIPTQSGRRAFTPSPGMTVLVAVALAVAAALTFGATGALRTIAPSWFVRAGLGVLAGVFLLRAVGDFRVIGFSKRVRDTAFARMDTTVFAPLCAGLAVACGMLAWLGDA
jgi:hypothetical protein